MNTARGFARRPQHTSGPSLAPYVRTMPAVIEAMLQLGQVKASDVLYDLGCGDGRILLTAAQQRGASGLGVDIDPERVQDARRQARSLGVEDRVKFARQNLLTLDLSAATVVTLYLLPQSNLRLRSKLQTELAPGTRILSHSFDMGDWPPTATSSTTDAINTYPIYLWVI